MLHEANKKGEVLIYRILTKYPKIQNGRVLVLSEG